MHYLAGLIMRLGNLAEAEKLYRQALEIRIKNHGENHADVSATMTNVALLEQAKKNYSRAEELFRRVIKINESLHGLDSHQVWLDIANLSDVLKDQKRYSEAEQQLRIILTEVEKKFGKEHILLTTWLRRIAMLEMDEKDVSIFLESVEASLSDLKPEGGIAPIVAQKKEDVQKKIKLEKTNENS